MRYLNTRLITEPLNWGIVFVIATIWLLFFHVIMTGFSAMQNSMPVDNSGQAPGTSPAIGASTAGPPMMPFNDGIFTDGYESSYNGF